MARRRNSEMKCILCDEERGRVQARLVGMMEEQQNKAGYLPNIDHELLRLTRADVSKTQMSRRSGVPQSDSSNIAVL